MHFYIHIIIKYFIINNNVFIVTDERTSTAHNQNDRRTPSPTSVQTGGSSSDTSVLGYTLHPMRVYDTKYGVKGADFKIT